MGARALSHSGFFCGRRGARSIWTSSTELAIQVIRCEPLLYDSARHQCDSGTQVMLPRRLFLVTMTGNGHSDLAGSAKEIENGQYLKLAGIPCSRLELPAPAAL